MNSMLDKRAQILLKTLIERYIAEGQPVGSRTLSRYSGLELSPATIRNVMADLEELGFIASPHTSAGRVPTPARLPLLRRHAAGGQAAAVAATCTQLEDQLHPDNPQRVIQTASQLLSQLTQFAGVVMTPRRAITFQHIEFLRLSEKRILLIMVTPDGDVQNRILFTERDYRPSELVEAANYINQNYAGQSFEDVRARLQARAARACARTSTSLMSAALDAGSALAEGGEQYVISGERNLLAVQDLSQDMGRLQAAVRAVRAQDLAGADPRPRAARPGRADLHRRRVRRRPRPTTSAWSPRPTRWTARWSARVGVIGPTRMAYERVMPIVDITAKLLSSALSQH